MSAWVAWRAGMSPALARSIVAIAERVAELPASIEAFRRGELSLDQMVTSARNAPAWAAVQSRDDASVMTVTQLRHVLRKYPFPVLDDDGRELPDEPPATADAASGHAASGDGGSVDTPEDEPDTDAEAKESSESDAGMIVQAALDEARDRLFPGGDVGAGLVEALVEMAQSSLDTVADQARCSRFRVNLFINTDRDERGMADATGWNVPDAIRRYLTYNGTVAPVFLENGLPVSVGRTQYVVPARARTVLGHRDHGVCRVPGCDATLGLEFRNQHSRLIAPSGAAPTVPPGPPPKPATVDAYPDGGQMNGYRADLLQPASHLLRRPTPPARNQQ